MAQHRYCLASSLDTPVLKLDCVLKAHEIPKRVRGECAQSHRFVVLYRVMVLRVAENITTFQVLVQFPRWSVNGSVLVSSFRTHTTLVFSAVRLSCEYFVVQRCTLVRGRTPGPIASCRSLEAPIPHARMLTDRVARFRMSEVACLFPVTSLL